MPPLDSSVAFFFGFVFVVLGIGWTVKWIQGMLGAFRELLDAIMIALLTIVCYFVSFLCFFDGVARLQ